MKNLLIPCFVAFAAVANAADDGRKAATPEETLFQIDKTVLPLLDAYCYSCHDADTMKGDIRLDNLGALLMQEALSTHRPLGAVNLPLLY